MSMFSLIKKLNNSFSNLFPKYNKYIIIIICFILCSNCRGVSVTQLNATDLDFDGKSSLYFAIAAGNENGKFKINSKTGLILVNNSENLEEFYKLKVFK